MEQETTPKPMGSERAEAESSPWPGYLFVCDLEEPAGPEILHCKTRWCVGLCLAPVSPGWMFRLRQTLLSVLHTHTPPKKSPSWLPTHALSLTTEPSVNEEACVP